MNSYTVCDSYGKEQEIKSDEVYCVPGGLEFVVYEGGDKQGRFSVVALFAPGFWAWCRKNEA